MEVITLTKNDLEIVVGGRNSWKDNVLGLGTAAIAGGTAGYAVCGPACAYVGAHYGAIGWAAITGLSGGFGHIK